MRNSFTPGEKKSSSAAETDLFGAPQARSSSPDQMALVWNGGEEAVVASPARGGAGNFEIDLCRVPANFKLPRAVQTHRESRLGLPPLSYATQFLTATPYFSERTRVLALAPEVSALDDFQLAVWLANAEKEMALGTDNHPLFESALEDTACTIVRLPNGKVAMTEAPRHHVQAARDNLRSLLGEAAAPLSDLTIETPLRCVARYFLTATPLGGSALAAGKDSEATAFLLITETGFSYGLWSPAAGLFSEYAFLAPTEINKTHSRTVSTTPAAYAEANDESRSAPQTTPDAAAPADAETARAARLEDYVRHAFDQLSLQLSPEKLYQLGLTRYARAVCAGDASLAGLMSAVAEEYSVQTGIEFYQMPGAVEEIVAGGLLFGSFTFGAEIPAGARILPQVNVARDLLALADKEEVERRQAEAVRLQNRKRRAAFTILAAPVLTTACLLAFAASILLTQILTGVRDMRADERASELKPALDRRKSYEANLKWYQEFITQVSRLRRQQPAGIGLQYQLNSHYPFNLDPSFYVSDLKLNADGTVEISGLARNKDSVTSFLRALEFAGGERSGSKLFDKLTYEVQEAMPAAAIPAAQTKLPAMSSTNLTGNVTPGVVAWNMKGVYVPMVEFIPPPEDPKKKKAAAKPEPGASPAASPSATPTP